MNIFQTSAIGSLLTQATTGIIELTGLGVKVKPEDEIVKDILRVELIVQLIEFIFYCYLVYLILYSTVDGNVTSHRYFDWSLTTPIMLVNFVVFFKYLDNPKRKIQYLESVKEDIYPISLIIFANMIMLLLGYFGETGIFNNNLTTALGFLPFAFMFKQIYAKYVPSKFYPKLLFYFIFSIWGLYGVAAVLSFKVKNTFYNILDLFAKNAFGFLIYIFILVNRID